MGGTKLPLKRIQEFNRKSKRRKEPLWKGPEEDGITQSLLSRFLVCQERFRVYVIDGLKPIHQFNRATLYGSMWHVCEEAHAAGKPWEGPLANHVQEVGRQFVGSRQDVEHWYNICRTQFPIYVKHWEDHKDVKKRVPMLQEQVFWCPYKLPSGREIVLRGMWDSVDLINKGIWLQENKTKGDVDEQKLKSELANNLQTMFYLTALDDNIKKNVEPYDLEMLNIFDGKKYKMASGPPPVKGVRYNVVRRPCSGGKFSISQKKGRLVNKKLNGKVVRNEDGTAVKVREGAQTPRQFYQELGELIEREAPYFFMRWQVQIFQSDLKKFQHEVLNPVLENLCDWYEWVSWCHERDTDRFDGALRHRMFPYHTPRPFRLPFGLWNPIVEGRVDELNDYLTTGSTGGLQRVETLFGELGA